MDEFGPVISDAELAEQAAYDTLMLAQQRRELAMEQFAEECAADAFAEYLADCLANGIEPDLDGEAYEPF